MVTVMGHPQWNIRPPGPVRPAVLALWSPPHPLAAPFFRMMAGRGDFQSYDEPFSSLAAERRYRVGGQTVTDPDRLLDEILAAAQSVPVVYKDTTEYRHCELFADPRLFYEVEHTFLIGEPRGPIETRYAADPRVSRAALGYEHVYEIFDLVCAATGRVPVIVDADVLAERPAATVRAYCAAVGIDFDPDALSWDPHAEPEIPAPPAADDPAPARGRWRREPDRGPQDGPGPQLETDPVLAAHYAHHLPFYERMLEHALVVPGV